MTGRTFVDTNIWVYAVDGADPAKQALAREALTASGQADLVVSAQVLGEFWVVATRKLVQPVAAADARAMVDRMRRLPVVAIDADLVVAAIEGTQAWQVSYWDALVIAAAAAAGCNRLLSEDLAHGARYAGVVVEDPFRARRVSETVVPYGPAWDDDELRAALATYEQACEASGMRKNAVHSYWDYARRFLEWRTGDYRPRGARDGGRPVTCGAVTADELADQASQYARAIERAGREQSTIETYHRHAMFFVRWLRGEFNPGGRLR